MRRERLRIVVAGMVRSTPGQGGAAWAVLQWFLGLRALGHEVLLVDPPDIPPVASAFCARADVLFNLSGRLRDPSLVEPVPTRVYVDLDPAFTQLWHARGENVGLDGHTLFVTVGLEVGTRNWMLPDCGVEWITTLPPVSLEHWPVAGDVRTHALTTVANWRGYESIEHCGVRYGQKAHSWRGLMTLPRRSAIPCMPALAIHPHEEKDLSALEEHGWRLVDPSCVASTPDDYRAFVQGSLGELGIAKSGYVVSRSGWFSDRSACYLASGRPVVAQDTGWRGHLPCGEGLIAFADEDEAVNAIAAIAADPQRHGRAARSIAEAHLDSRRVLGRLLDVVAR